MKGIKEKASIATMQSFLNCYIKESQEVQFITETQKSDYNLSNLAFDNFCLIPLKIQNIEIVIPLKYKSATGRHLFNFPIYYRSVNSDIFLDLDYITMVAIVSKEVRLQANQTGSNDELMHRVILSNNNIEKFIKYRSDDKEGFNKIKKNFIESEQSLILGHLLHPTPKSRQGMTDDEEISYSPELKGHFQLHYFRAHPSIVQEKSALNESTTNLIKQELLSDKNVSFKFKEDYCKNDEYSLLPMHPLQAKFLLNEEKIKAWIDKGLLEYLGAQGSDYLPTSSVRTVYNQESRFMYKFSLNVKITNSLRVNKMQELERGVEVARLLNTEIGDYLQGENPNFNIIKDPAYITLKCEEDESGFEIMLRDNPFRNDAEEVTLLAGLCQDNPFTGESHLSNIIKNVAEKEGSSTQEVSIKWFKKYLNLSLNPILSLYLKYGIALEAHQQNSVLKLDNGYPSEFYYRDNQGYYYCESLVDKLQSILPNISADSNTICSDGIADERLGYYLFFNHLFGLVNAFGTAELIEEALLLNEIKKVLIKISNLDRDTTNLLSNFINMDKLPCKSNLLTRLYDMDELVGSLETQSVYVQGENPLKTKVGVLVEN